MKQPKMIDNKNNKMIDEIKEYAKTNSKISVLSASFTLFSIEKLKKNYQKLRNLDLFSLNQLL